jgi:hypothetical protein
MWFEPDPRVVRLGRQWRICKWAAQFLARSMLPRVQIRSRDRLFHPATFSPLPDQTLDRRGVAGLCSSAPTLLLSPTDLHLPSSPGSGAGFVPEIVDLLPKSFRSLDRWIVATEIRGDPHPVDPHRATTSVIVPGRDLMQIVGRR